MEEKYVDVLEAQLAIGEAVIESMQKRCKNEALSSRWV